MGTTDDDVVKYSVLALALLIFGAWPISAVADQDPAAELAGKRFVLLPTIALTDVGVDTNILGTSRNPKQDTTSKLNVQVEPSFRFRSTRVSGKFIARQSYFREYAYERSLDTDDLLNIESRVGRLTGYASGSFVRTRDLFDPELFARTRRTQHHVEIGTALRLTGKTRVSLAVRQARIDFDRHDALFNDGLRDALNRGTRSLTLSVRNAVTPRTILVLTGEHERDQFDFMPLRNATMTHVMAGAEFESVALAGSKVYVGYRTFQPIERLSQDVGGIVGSIDLGHTIAGFVRVSVHMDRNLAQSFRVSQPYVISTQANSSVATRLSRTWEITMAAGRQWLDHRAFDPDMMSPSVEQSERLVIDSGASFGTMFRYSFGVARRGPAATVGLVAEHSQLHSTVDNHDYDRFRLVSSIVWRF